MRAWWAAAKRRFWGSWHALAGYLPNVEPPLADHERLPPSPDAVLDFVEAVLSSAGEQRLLPYAGKGQKRTPKREREGKTRHFSVPPVG